MEVINLNFIPSGANPVAHASQFDEGRTTRFNLFDGSAVYTLDGTEIITVSVRKPDGHIVTESVTNTSSTYVEVVTTEQMTACAGDNLAQIKVEKGGDTIGFLNYILSVQKDPEDGGDPSASFIHDLEQQIADAVADQYDAADVIFDAAPTAGHGVGFAVTSEGVKNALDAVAATIPEELGDLQDVTTSAPTSGEALVWDGSKWTNGMPSVDLDDLGDVEITTPTAGEILEFDGAEWVNVPNPASTTNFGAPYDENNTYNVPSLVIYNNLLYKLNEGEDGTTGPWDPTKWTQTSVAELAALIGDLSTLTTTVKSSLVGAVNEVDGAVGDLTTLTTTNKSSAVGAINEVNAKFKTEKVNFSKAVASGNNAFSVAPAHKPAGYVIVAATVDTSDTGIAGATNRFTVALFSNAEAWVYITANSNRTINGSVLFVYAKSFDFT